MNAKQEKICSSILKHYGLENQLGICQEECAELIQVISKYIRMEKSGYNEIERTKNNITLEIADVLIMIQQIKEGLNISDEELNYMINFKLDRQVGRMEAGI